MSPDLPLFRLVLGHEWDKLPLPLRRLHSVAGRQSFEGMASVQAGANLFAGLVRRIIGFPAAGASVPVRVTIERRGDTERWTREFGAQKFQSVLGATEDGARGELNERFGALRFRMRLSVDPHGLSMQVLRAEWFGIPLPGWLTPGSEAREFSDEQGRFHFDVAVGLRGIGQVVHYRGWLDMDNGAVSDAAGLR